MPNKDIAACEASDSATTAALPLLEGKTAIDNKATAYVCENFACQLPATSVEELRERLGR
jgi:uncharacterized protein YyaL (SSP411 family)